MPPPLHPSSTLSRWLVIPVSLAIACHLTAVVAAALAAPSGPWPTPEGSTLATPPQFAYGLNEFVAPYLKLVRLTEGYHFASNRPGLPGAQLEFQLKDDKGQPTATVKLPEDGVNFWVRHRQGQLARALADDQLVPPPAGEAIAAPNQQVRSVRIWDMTDNRGLVLKTVPEHLVPRDRPVFTPSDWSLVLARSYARYLCRVHGAASAELVRHTQEAIPPAVLFNEPPAGAFDPLHANFGELSR